MRRCQEFTEKTILYMIGKKDPVSVSVPGSDIKG